MQCVERVVHDLQGIPLNPSPGVPLAQGKGRDGD